MCAAHALTTLAISCLHRFHLLKPEYVHHRIKELQRSFRLRLLICHIDVEDVVEPLAQVIKAALLNEITLICGWSPEVWVQSKHVLTTACPTGHIRLCLTEAALL